MATPLRKLNEEVLHEETEEVNACGPPVSKRATFSSVHGCSSA